MLEASVYKHDERISKLEGLVESNTGMIRQLVDALCLLRTMPNQRTNALKSWGKIPIGASKSSSKPDPTLTNASMH